MSDPSAAVIILPRSVDDLLHTASLQHSSSPPPSPNTRLLLASLPELDALEILHTVLTSSTPVRSLDGFIHYLAKKLDTKQPLSSPARLSPPVSQFKKSMFITPSSPPPPTTTVGYGYGYGRGEVLRRSGDSGYVKAREVSPQLRALGELDFRKAFLILCYIGRWRLEDVVSDDVIRGFKSLSMPVFENKLWSAFGRRCILEKDRMKVVGRDSQNWNTYHCLVDADGTCTFKGQYVHTAKTHLQRILEDDNVLLVRFSDDISQNNSAFRNIFNDGIWVGLRCYRFFVFKDGGKVEKSKNQNTSGVRCYFVRMESSAASDVSQPYVLTGKTIYEARCIFMHAHTVSSLEKFMSRFSLILSKTAKLNIDLAYVNVSTIEDIKCRNADGSIAHSNNGEALIHTDGTGFVSEDIALRCPRNLYKGEMPNYERFCNDVDLGDEDSSLYLREPPLLMQVRLFFNGCAVKGTLLVNRKVLVNKTSIQNNSDQTLYDQG